MASAPLPIPEGAHADNISSSPSDLHSRDLGFVNWIEGTAFANDNIVRLMAVVLRNVEQSNIQRKKSVDKNIFHNTFEQYH